MRSIIAALLVFGGTLAAGILLTWTTWRPLLDRIVETR